MKWLLVFLLAGARLLGAPLTIATYNLEFYIDTPTLGVAPKAEEARRLIRTGIKRMNPDVIALQEMGSTNAFQELRAALRGEGLSFPHAEYVRATDSNLHLAFLSRFPIVARRPHTSESFLYQGKRFQVARGFAEIEIQTGNTRVTFISAHLKSKRQIGEADQQGLREEESVRLRERIDEFFQREPGGKLVVLGDFNDDISSKTFSDGDGTGFLTRDPQNLTATRCRIRTRNLSPGALCGPIISAKTRRIRGSTTFF